METVITNPARLLAPVHLKKCTHKDCLQWKPYSEFRKHAGYADGYKSWCKECSRLYQLEWYRKKNALNPKYPRSRWTPPSKPEPENGCLWTPFEPLRQCRRMECLKFKPVSQFRNDSRYSGKRKTWCRECEIKYSREWRNLNRSEPERSFYTAVDAPIKPYRGHRKYSIITPRKIAFRFVIARNIAYTRKELKRLRGNDPVPTTNIFTTEEFVELGLIRRDAPVPSHYFLEHKIKPHQYVPLVKEEFLAKDEYCYGEPPSSFKDFIKDAGEVKYLMTLDEDGNYLHERVMEEENILEIQVALECRPELLRVA